MIKKNYNRFKNLIKRLFKIIRRPEMIILPGNISYSLILSIFPAVMIIGYIISKFNISTTVITDLFASSIPKDILDIILKFLSEGIGGGNIILTIFLALVFSSNGTRAIIVAANILYKNQDTDSLKRYIKSFLLVFVHYFLK